MRSVKPIKNEIKKLQMKLNGQARDGAQLITDSVGNKYRVIDGRRELINEDTLKAQIKRQEEAIKTVQTRTKRSKHKVAAPAPSKKSKKNQKKQG